jgi:hypothetical protein
MIEALKIEKILIASTDVAENRTWLAASLYEEFVVL